MSKQLSHTETYFQKKQFPLILFLDNVTGEANIGSLFRLADAFGVERMIFGGTLPNLNSNRLTRTARNTQNTVNFEFTDNSKDLLQKLKKEKYRIISVEITSESKPIQNFKVDNGEKIVLMVGNERHGISEELLALSDEVFHIEMFGDNSSMNVAQSAGIALYEITKTLNKFQKK
ncbi:TrmH family RNA methyltransferase [Gramella sp. KN1008]|uniref:TrmH family RNA methyltransferase n=1 Tax=Gramella sp. KN1008 TaxID=2529298 RepID=UPI001038F5EB|nr:TrmH family RNA methyltransferase [Gramella sp. KN1008]TBW29251.1 TrmH family RNA methyltransferase [Gramella sp. KN1008]